MSDLIDRQMVIDAIQKHYCNTQRIIDAVEALPSAQPENRTDKRTETHACDCISRKEAIELVGDLVKGILSDSATMSMKMSPDYLLENLYKPIRQMPPVQDKYEYHYDHTDCIWYRPEARNRCPSTCAQYRDGWNDAMNYIFRDGDGYRPFRRDKKYEE